MKNQDIQALSRDEVTEKIKSESEALRKLKFAHRVSAIENPMKIRETRKLIARLRTQLTIKESSK